MTNAPYPPLLSAGEILQSPPVSADKLRLRMADVYGVPSACVLPVRGKWHGVALVLRYAARDGATRISAPFTPELDRLAKIAGLAIEPGHTAIGFFSSPNDVDGGALTVDAVQGHCARCRVVLVDESLIEFSDADSLAPHAAAGMGNCAVLRDLGAAYGVPGEPCGALIAHQALIAELEALLEPEALSTSAIRTALAVLDPAKATAYARRFEEVRAERRRVADALQKCGAVSDVKWAQGPFVFATPANPDRVVQAVRLTQADVEVKGGRAVVRVGAPAANDRALAALGVDIGRTASRRAEIVRETLETRIVAVVDLDKEGASAISTGVGFYDHMLTQVAAHGGFSIQLHCNGDLEIDAHHTIEDCALALGEALKKALGDRRGIGRFGFVLPMDEAEAKVSVDLGGRPYLVFEAAFNAPLIGAYPVEMTEHVFRSLAQSMGASIHVAVAGENDHHKTEACFKAFGRALRQAVRIEGQALPSTKGVIA